ncbi:Tyrosine-protein kinase transmembrane modulator EpsC [Streptococcus sp. DD11]|uniref:Wzz/FepE/Etk N-terminal domain-containing protein n=1 Tax=Streptococcus sp. DD11 TaxID=1777879 RepID=UPI000795F4A2|nr:Wzz/FepE/Etk N-terminal domain-containing protein [Streptococcus sp. DD11]KXT85160.1 Tyrosine-protein kinase transmembrane modulator EpsC [Streptococcus sp. DD11]
MEKQDTQIVEIDILSLLRTLWLRKFTILLGAVLFSLLAFGYSVFIAKKTYQSTTRIYVVSRQNEAQSALTNQDLQAGSYLVKDFKEIILSQAVLSQAISELQLQTSPDELAQNITVSVPADTRIVSITVKDSSPEEAARIANAFRNIAAEKIIEVTKVPDVTTLEEASVAQEPSSPNIRRNVLLGFVGGAVLVAFFIITVEILDDRVKKPEDIEEVLGLTLLGVIPDMKKM